MRCAYDGCHDFDPVVHNQQYCTPCNCKRRQENAKKRLTQEIKVYDTEVWELEERRKLSRAERQRAKSKWILENRTFAAFDLETTNLSASIGEILCGSIKPLDGEVVTFASPRGDSKIVGKIRDELRKYDYIYTWYGARFDIPYLTTRLRVNGEAPIGTLRHIDMWFTARSVLKLHSNRLATVAETLFGDSGKTQIIGSIWNKAARGDKEALKYIVDHCVADVNVLERVFLELVPYRNLAATPVKVIS